MMSSNNPLVTVGIPTFNRPEGLESTLKCILGQTYKNLEIIVSDNCSTDSRVEEVVNKYTAVDSRVSFFKQAQNISIVPNFQFLLDKASGEYFMWAADDDSWDENFIETCLDGLERNEDAVLCIGNVKIVNLKAEHTDTALDRGFMQSNLYRRFFEWIKSSGETKYFFCGLYRTKIAQKIKFPGYWGGDHMFLLELLSYGKFLFLQSQTTFYYFRGGSSTNADRIKKAFNVKSRYFYSEAYVFRYIYQHMGFSNLSFLQKFFLLLVNSVALVFNTDKILYYALIKKVFMDFKNKIKKLLGSRRKHKLSYNQDGLSTVHNAGFMKDPEFAAAERQGAQTGSWSNIHWRVHTILWAANHCLKIPGDFVECGTNKGGFAKAILSYVNLNQSGKKFYLLDTFEGLDASQLTAEELDAGKKEHFENVYLNCYEQVVQTFSAYPYVKIIKGRVPDTLSQVDAGQISFLSIDMNAVVPEIEALNFFWDKLSTGGIVVLDDYGYVTCDSQYKAHNEWAKSKGVKILTIPTGQGLIIK